MNLIISSFMLSVIQQSLVLCLVEFLFFCFYLLFLFLFFCSLFFFEFLDVRPSYAAQISLGVDLRRLNHLFVVHVFTLLL